MGPKLEDYEIIDTIGRGSHGTIRKVKRKSNGELLVWKELHYASMNEAEKQGLVLEVNLLRELYHPNIVRFFNHLVERHTGTLYIFMEYCPGGDLRHLVGKCRKTGSFLEEGFIWRVLKQVCEALRACHEKQTKDGVIILHRDIKPANIFLDASGNIKVGDFGLARTLNSNASFAKTFVGTPYYMSPEVIDGKEYNEQSDIWSLGCLMYELCSLEPPFNASNQNDLYFKIKSGRYKRIPVHYSNALWEVIQEMLARIDFLRPSAFLILQNSTLKLKTAEKETMTDDLSDSLALSLDLEARIRNSSASKSGINTTDEENSFTGTVKEREQSEEEKRLEESLMREVESMMLESQLRKEKERNERLQGNKLNINSLAIASQNEHNHTVSNCRFIDKDKDGFQERLEKEPSPPKCVCGGTSFDEWRERVKLVRASEANVKQRELDVEERERELAKRERRVQTTEQEAKQYLVRAQIYLKQSKGKNQNLVAVPKLGRTEELSDFDATTVSADIGYDDRPTTAFIDTQPQNNPFLIMRENVIRMNRLTKYSTNLSRSNTLDNPKSRRKHGNYFYLEKDFEKSKENYQTKEQSVAIELTKMNEAKINEKNGKENSKNLKRDLTKLKEMKKIQNEDKDNFYSKGNAKNTFTNFRQNWTKHLRKSGKENNCKHPSASKEKSKDGCYITRFQSKGVCAKPNLKPSLIPLKARAVNQCNSAKQYNHQDNILRIYNAV